MLIIVGGYMTKSFLSIQKLTKYYGDIKGVENLSLELESGEIFGFIGPNGSGKSTTIRCIMNLINKNNGKVFINGESFEKDNVNLKKEIGYVPSEIYLYDDLTVKEMLDYHETFYDKNIHERRNELVERLKLDESKYIEDLSLGNLKKLGIILALMHEPKLLILDEPTSGLDPLMQKEFFDILKERNQNGTTIFLSSHILSEVQNHCKRAAIIREGRIIACDSVEMLAKTNAKRISIAGDICIDKLNGVRDIQKQQDTITFLYSGDINLLIKYLSETKVKDISITEPDLEEIFMHYYKEEER